MRRLVLWVMLLLLTTVSVGTATPRATADTPSAATITLDDVSHPDLDPQRHRPRRHGLGIAPHVVEMDATPVPQTHVQSSLRAYAPRRLLLSAHASLRAPPSFLN